MRFEVLFSAAADDDLARLVDFLLDRAETLADLDSAQAAVDAVRAAVLNPLAATPCSFRKAGKSPTRRELIIPYGATGHVALCEIASPSSVVVLALRHQLEDDYR